MATDVQHDILEKRFRKLMSKLQKEGARNIAVMAMWPFSLARLA